MNFVVPERLKAGDKVAIIAPSSGIGAVFPWVLNLGVSRIQEIFGLQTVLYPTTKKSDNTLEERAQDIHDAFSDPEIKGVFCVTGGFDEVRLIPHLKAEVFQKNPKVFMGFSDNTNLHLFLWNLGIVSYYGGHVLSQFGMQGKMHEFTVNSIRKALFENEIGEIIPSQEFTDFDLEWSEEANLTKTRPIEKNPGWSWFQSEMKNVSGTLWGGCLESLAMNLMSDRNIPEKEKLKNCILFLETSEELPSASFVSEFFISLGERNLLGQFSGILVGRPKSQYRGQFPTGGRENYVNNQNEAIKKIVSQYCPEIPVVFNLHFGHTDPQTIIPSGGIAQIDGNNRKIIFKY